MATQEIKILTEEQWHFAGKFLTFPQMQTMKKMEQEGQLFIKDTTHKVARNLNIYVNGLKNINLACTLFRAGKSYKPDNKNSDYIGNGCQINSNVVVSYTDDAYKFIVQHNTAALEVMAKFKVMNYMENEDIVNDFLTLANLWIKGRDERKNAPKPEKKTARKKEEKIENQE